LNITAAAIKKMMISMRMLYNRYIFVGNRRFPYAPSLFA
jgi:hypothetical protein